MDNVSPFLDSLTFISCCFVFPTSLDCESSFPLFEILKYVLLLGVVHIDIEIMGIFGNENIAETPLDSELSGLCSFRVFCFQFPNSKVICSLSLIDASICLEISLSEIVLFSNFSVLVVLQLTPLSVRSFDFLQSSEIFLTGDCIFASAFSCCLWDFFIFFKGIP